MNGRAHLSLSAMVQMPMDRIHDLHTPLYDFNDDILCLGATYWCALALTELRGG